MLQDIQKALEELNFTCTCKRPFGMFATNEEDTYEFFILSNGSDESCGIFVYHKAVSNDLVSKLQCKKVETVIAYIKRYTDPQIVLNSASCPQCNETLISHYTHNFVTCHCDNRFSVDGGNSYLKRGGKCLRNTIDHSLRSDEDFTILRDNIYRGSRGKDGDEPLKWLKLSEISNLYLANLIKYCEDNNQYGSVWYTFYLDEEYFRVQNNIYVVE